MKAISQSASFLNESGSYFCLDQSTRKGLLKVETKGGLQSGSYFCLDQSTSKGLLKVETKGGLQKYRTKMYKEPEDLAQRIMNLQTEAEDEDVTKVLFKIKSTAYFEENVTNLSKTGKEMVTVKMLRSALAFLHDTTVDDRRVAILHKSGLCKMIMVRIYQLAPQFCDKCMKFHYTMRGQVPVISRLRCGTGACPAYYKREENPTLKKWKYICEECETIVQNDMGFGRLDKKDWDQEYDKKKGNSDSSQKKDVQDTPEKPTEENVEEEEIVEIAEKENENENDDLENDNNLAAAAAKM